MNKITIKDLTGKSMTFCTEHDVEVIDTGATEGVLLCKEWILTEGSGDWTKE